MHFGNFTDIKQISQGFSDCELHNDKYTKYSPHKKCVNRACIESLMAREKFGISKRKVQIIVMMGS
jgi:hypothetical protein